MHSPIAMLHFFRMDFLFSDPDPNATLEDMMKNPYLAGFFGKIPNGDPSKGIMPQVIM